MNVMPSMGSVGDAFDNAMAESFFATLEKELQSHPSTSSGGNNRGKPHNWKVKNRPRKRVNSTDLANRAAARAVEKARTPAVEQVISVELSISERHDVLPRKPLQLVCVLAADDKRWHGVRATPSVPPLTGCGGILYRGGGGGGRSVGGARSKRCLPVAGSIDRS
jgi:hypothetical protein